MKQFVLSGLAWAIVLLVMAAVIGLLAWAALAIWTQVGALW